MTTAHVLATAAALCLTLGPVARAQAHVPIKIQKDPAHAAHSGEHMSGWKELDAYHRIMMTVWHPAKEKADLAPIRARASALAASADAWSASAIPGACDNASTRENVPIVATESHALAALVGTGSDAEVTSALRALHDRFERVNRSCRVSAHER